jgi:serine/threonine protein kinase
MSPEQISGGKVTFATDIFSLGIVLYEVLTGQHPFTGSNPQAVLHQIVEGKYREPVEINSLLPPSLNQLIKKSLQKNIAERISLEDMSQYLSRYIKELNLEEPEKEIKKWLVSKEEYEKQINKRLANYHLAEGLKSKKNQNFHQALFHFEQVLKIDPENQQVHTALLEIQRRSLRKKKAVFLISLLSIGLIFFLLGLFFVRLYLFQPKLAKERPAIKTKDIFSSLPEKKEEEEKIFLPQPKGKEVEKEGMGKEKGKRREEEKKEEKGKRKISSKHREERSPQALLPGFLVIYTEIDGIPCWAKIYLGEKEIGQSPTKTPLKLPPGRHKLTIKNPYCYEKEAEVVIKSRQQQVLNLSLEKK